MYSSETLFPRAPETQASCYLPGKVAVGDWSSLIGLECSGHRENTRVCPACCGNCMGLCSSWDDLELLFWVPCAGLVVGLVFGQIREWCNEDLILEWELWGRR